MCYSGKCPYENYQGDCTLSAEECLKKCPSGEPADLNDEKEEE